MHDTPITASPPTATGCARSGRSAVPTTSTSAIHAEHVRADDREDVALGVMVVVDDHVAGQVHHRDHHAEAGERGDHRRDHARAVAGSRGAAPPARAARRSRAAPSCSAISLRIGPHVGDDGERHQRRGRRRRATGRSARRPRRACPAKSGLKTAGPRIAPKTEPKSTSEIPRARRSGGYMSPAAVRIEERDRPGRRRSARSPRSRRGRRLDLRRERGQRSSRRPRARSRTPSPACARTGPSLRPAGTAVSAEAVRKIAGPRPSSPSTPGHEHERERRDRGHELEDGGVDRHRRGQQHRVATDRERLRHEAIESARRESPERRRATDGGCRSRRAPRAPGGRPARAGGRGPAAARKGCAASISPRVGRRFDSGVTRERADASARGSRAARRVRAPSSPSTRWTMVAVASPGPSPLSWRSLVNGIPETRAPR